MEKSIDDYRIVEQIDGFVVQRKEVEIVVVGALWWKKSIEKVNWYNLNKIGRLPFISIITPPTKTKKYKSFEEAKKAIEKFVKYPIYHYFTKQEDCEENCGGCKNCFPKFPIDAQTEQ